jgi:Reverse transcriptase (RNA-dependent DNA polymerase)/GAG-pre-integrase domain
MYSVINSAAQLFQVGQLSFLLSTVDVVMYYWLHNEEELAGYYYLWYSVLTMSALLVLANSEAYSIVQYPYRSAKKKGWKWLLRIYRGTRTRVERYIGAEVTPRTCLNTIRVLPQPCLFVLRTCLHRFRLKALPTCPSTSQTFLSFSRIPVLPVLPIFFVKCFNSYVAKVYSIIKFSKQKHRKIRRRAPTSRNRRISILQNKRPRKLHYDDALRDQQQLHILPKNEGGYDKYNHATLQQNEGDQQQHYNSTKTTIIHDFNSNYSNGKSHESCKNKNEVHATSFSTMHIGNGRKAVVFDSDSKPIKIDNCSTRTMSCSINDFLPETMRVVKNKNVHGYGGSVTPITHQGTIRWDLLDDRGMTRTLVIPNSFFVPSSKVRLLSPQHLAQQRKDDFPIKDGTRCITNGDSIILQWDQRKIKVTAKLDPNASNVATLWTSPGYKKAMSFCAACEAPEVQIVTMDVTTDEFEPTSLMYKGNITEPSDKAKQSALTEEGGTSPVRSHPLVTDFDITPKNEGDESSKESGVFKIDGPNIELQNNQDESTQNQDASIELLGWHHRFKHISMKRLQSMAELGYLPKRLSKCRIPICQACVYGKSTRRAWRTKKLTESVKVTTPGEFVSVDQLESTLPGLFGQMKGRLTRDRYRVATVFVDHHTNFSYVHLQQSTASKETLEAKQAFEKLAESHGIRVKHYRADNGRFADKLWRNDIIQKGQRLSFCGVGAHHQNGRAEKRIRDIQDQARTSLIHANLHWPEAIDARLWPYAVRCANEALVSTPFPGNKLTPLEMFANTKIAPRLLDQHPFGCPAYALDGRLQSGKQINKWAMRSRLAVYLGTSTQHSQSVGLVLSLSTGLVSPQFHVIYDNHFETVRNDKAQSKSLWQSLCGFQNSINTKSLEQRMPDPIIPNTKLNPIEEIVPMIDNDVEQQDDDDQDNTNSDVESLNEDVQIRDEVRIPVRTTRSGRNVYLPSRYNDFVALETNVPQDMEQESIMFDPIALASSSDPDVMYLDEALRQPDRKQFVEAMRKEVQSHTENDNWKIIRKSEVPKGHKILPAVWAMRRKRDISTQQVYKWKARLNVHGGKQTKGLNYWDTYAPVASWASIRLILNTAALMGWTTRQLDFVLAFPQAPVETDIYMQIPAGFELQGDKKDYALHLINNLYGQKQAGRVWNLFLAKGLQEIGFHQSKCDPCIFWRKQTIIVIYTDDTIVTGSDTKQIDDTIRDIANKFDITSKDEVNDFLGVKIHRDAVAGTFTLTQPQLIKSILSDLGLQGNSNGRRTPALASRILHAYNESAPHDASWHYRSVVGKLNYLEKSTRPDIAYAVHQCARFSENPKIEHSAAIKLIGRYLLATADKGIICTPNNQSFDCFCDADFSGNWNPDIAEYDGTTARSRSGYVITYAGCPIVWASRLQTEIALSSTESEYVSLSQSLREVLPLIRLVEELVNADFQLAHETPKVHCKVFEDNSGALEMAKTHKMRPRTKHMNIKYHHFREAVQNGEVTIHPIDTLDQLADIFTKPLGFELFESLRKGIMGW